MNIAIIGSTGMVGQPVTKELLKAGFGITALVRSVKSAEKIFPEGVNFVEGDLQDLDSILATLKDADGLYINLSTRENDKESIFNPEVGGLDNILAAVKQSALQRVIYLSSFLARNYQGDWWVMNAKKAGITKVKDCGISHTIFYPSNFMENFNHGMVQGNKLMLAGHHKHKAWWISGKDFGMQVANAFRVNNTSNYEYTVQGLDAYSTEAAAKLYVEHYPGERLQISQFPMFIFKLMGLVMGSMNFLGNLMTIMNNNNEIFESQRTWDDLGKPKITLEQFAARGDDNGK